jgi:hypothetical protein
MCGLLVATAVVSPTISLSASELFPDIKLKSFRDPVICGSEVGPAIMRAIGACDRVEVTTLGKKNLSMKRSVVLDKGIIDHLRLTLGMAQFQAKPSCWCVSYPSYAFYHGNTLVMQISFHHGHKIRAYGGLVSGDFEIGEFAVKEAADLLATLQ